MAGSPGGATRLSSCVRSRLRRSSSHSETMWPSSNQRLARAMRAVPSRSRA